MVAGQRIPNQFVPNVAADIVDLAAVPPANRFNKIYRQVRKQASIPNPHNTTPPPSLALFCVSTHLISSFLPTPPTHPHTQVESMVSNSSGLAERFGLQVEPSVVRVRGRFLQGPKVTVRGSNGRELSEQVRERETCACVR